MYRRRRSTTRVKATSFVSNDRVLSADIQNALNSNRVEKWLVHTDPYGNVTVGIFDKNGKFVIQPDSKIIGH